LTVLGLAMDSPVGVTMNRLFACAVLLLAASPAIAADANGYTAQYECRAGGPNCNVDVVSLTQQSCQQTISAGASWSSINWSNDVICIEAGDHTYKGVLTIPSSGTSSRRKVLRYSSTNDADSNPWNQAAAIRAKVAGITVNGAYWIVHRLTITGGGTDINQGNVVLNRVLGEFVNGTLIDAHESPNVTIQNSVLRKTGLSGRDDFHCTTSGPAQNFHLVNNEIYDCQGDGYQLAQSGIDSPGLVIENNDIYLTSAYYSNGSGSLTTSGSYACAENSVDLKQGGTSSSPAQIIHNRMWGHRMTDSSCADGSYGEELLFHQAATTENYYGVIQNNIIFDGTQAITSPNYTPNHWSIVGNVIYSFSGVPSGATRAVDLKHGNSSEIYLNTFVDVAKGNSTGWVDLGDGTNHDVKCNVAINAGSVGGSAGSSTEVGSNAFYNATLFAANNGGANVSRSIRTRANSTSYAVGDIVSIGPASACTSATASACFLYRVTTAGVSAGSPPIYCASLGCTTPDGSVTVQAIRGPYAFYRKLQTGPEVFVVPYARAHTAAPEAYLCPSDFASRNDVGIGD
jgi:hypothetical protein